MPLIKGLLLVVAAVLFFVVTDAAPTYFWWLQREKIHSLVKIGDNIDQAQADLIAAGFDVEEEKFESYRKEYYWIKINTRGFRPNLSMMIASTHFGLRPSIYHSIKADRENVIWEILANR